MTEDKIIDIERHRERVEGMKPEYEYRESDKEYIIRLERENRALMAFAEEQRSVINRYSELASKYEALVAHLLETNK